MRSQIHLLICGALFSACGGSTTMPAYTPTRAQSMPSASAPHTNASAPRETPRSAYAIDGSEPWKPVHVFNAGEQTVLDFPAALGSAEIPALVLLECREGPSTDCSAGTLVKMYWDPSARRMTVDAVIERALLTAGAGLSRSRIRLLRLR